MAAKTKIFYFAVFILVVVAFIFHVNAMGHHHWKRVTVNNRTIVGYNHTSIGLFTRCIIPSDLNKMETCFPNLYPRDDSCFEWERCLARSGNENCSCDYLPSTKGIASCAIIAAVFLGLGVILLFIHSVEASGSRGVELCLSLFPLILLLFAFIFILIALILVGSYLSRDVMHIVRNNTNPFNRTDLLQRASNTADIRIGWASGLEIIALVLTFFAFVLYSIYIFKLGRSS